MKQTLIFCYLVFFVIVLAPLAPSGYPVPDSPLWLVIFEIFSFGFVAISIFLYGASYRPKPFAWFWKVVPFTLIIYLAISWYWEFILYHEPDDSASKTAMATLFGLAVLFPAFYLSFKLGYSTIILPEKLRLKFSFKSIAIISAVTILCVATYFVPDTENKINIKVNYMAEYNKITKPANYDPNLNAAPYYEKAFELIVDMPSDIKDLVEKWPAAMNDTELETAKDLVESNSRALNYLKQAAQKPYYWIERQAKGNNLLEIEYSELKKVRYCIYLLILQTKLEASQDQIELALKQIADIYKIGTHFGPPKTLIDQLIGIAVSANALEAGFQIFDRTEPNPDSLRNFQQQIEELSASRGPIIDFTAERMMFYDQVQRLFTDDGQGNGHVYGATFLENPIGYFYRLLNPEKGLWTKTSRKESLELANKMYDYFDWARDKLPAQLYKEGKDPDKIAGEMVKDHYLLHILVPAIGSVLQVSYHLQAHTDALITTIALLRYKAERDRFPENLDELVVTGYLRELPIDPYSDSPLVYKQIGDDFVLYSFGADFDDDGGTPSKWGKGEQGGDQVFWPVNRKQE